MTSVSKQCNLLTLFVDILSALCGSQPKIDTYMLYHSSKHSISYLHHRPITVHRTAYRACCRVYIVGVRFYTVRSQDYWLAPPKLSPHEAYHTASLQQGTCRKATKQQAALDHGDLALVTQ